MRNKEASDVHTPKAGLPHSPEARFARAGKVRYAAPPGIGGVPPDDRVAPPRQVVGVRERPV